MSSVFRMLRWIAFFALLACIAICAVAATTSIRGAYIDESGSLVIEYSDGREQTLGTVVGADGVDGKDGADGIDGIDGKDGVGTGGAQTSLVDATTRGMRSAVSVVSTFKKSASSDEYYSAGAGVIYQLNKTTGSAFLITNHHVVYDEESYTADGISHSISVYLYGAEYTDYAIPASYVGGSSYYDIAVLYVQGCDALKTDMPMAISVADSDRITLGEAAIAIGNAEGHGLAATSGVVSVDSEHITLSGDDHTTRVIRVDTPINHGNSGGGLYNSRGELIGIVNAKTVSSDVDNIAYAIPSNVAVAVARNILDNCFGTSETSVMRPLLGVTITTASTKAIYDAEDKRVYIVEEIVIHSVNEGAPVSGMLQEGDIFVSIACGDRVLPVTRQYHVIDFMLDVRLGDTVSFIVRRGTEELTYSVTITADMITPY